MISITFHALASMDFESASARSITDIRLSVLAREVIAYRWSASRPDFRQKPGNQSACSLSGDCVRWEDISGSPSPVLRQAKLAVGEYSRSLELNVFQRDLIHQKSFLDGDAPLLDDLHFFGVAQRYLVILIV